MLMFTIKKILYYISICSLLQIVSINLSSAQSSFSQQFQMEPGIDKVMADRITDYYSEDIQLTLKQQKTELEQIEKQLQESSRSNFDKPTYWFITGLHHRNMAAFYTESKNSAAAELEINKKDRAYIKALELAKKAPQQLSVSIYSTMKHGLPETFKIEATQNELKQGGNGEDDSYYWYLHWSNIDQLQKAGRTREAEEAFRNMQQELESSGMDMAIYGKLNEQIEQQTFNKMDTKQPPPAPKPAPQTIKKSVTQPPSEAEKPIDRRYLIISLLVVFSLLSIALVSFYELVIKKRKNRK